MQMQWEAAEKLVLKGYAKTLYAPRRVPSRLRMRSPHQLACRAPSALPLHAPRLIAVLPRCAHRSGMHDFGKKGIDCLLSSVNIAPSINYIMRHPGMGPDASGLIRFAASKGIKTAVYGALGEPAALYSILKNPTLKYIAEFNGKTVEDVVLRWNLQAGVAVSNRITADYAPDGGVCTDDCRAAITAMVKAGEWALSEQEVEEIDRIVLSDGPPETTSVCKKFGAEVSAWC